MLHLYLTDRGDRVLYCPLCERELIPAYETADGLEVGYWPDFSPGDARTGLLVCGDFACPYEEPVTFASAPADAVVVSLDETLALFEGENYPGMPAAAAAALATELAEMYRLTGRPKQRCAAAYFSELARERRERVDGCIAAAGSQCEICFEAEGDQYQGRVVAQSGDHFSLRTDDGTVLIFPKDRICQERVVYPRKPRRPDRPPGAPEWVALEIQGYIVVEGHHLAYGYPRELGLFSGTTTDPKVAAALRLRRISEQVWEGLFRREEIERYYWRRRRVLIRGFWLEQIGRTLEQDFVQARTRDPAVAGALDMAPEYALEFTEYGCRDGDVVAWTWCFPVAEVEDTSCYEEVGPLPDDEED